MFISYGTCFVFIIKFIVCCCCFLLLSRKCQRSNNAEVRMKASGEVKMVLNFRFKTMLWCINVFYALSNRAQIESRCWTVSSSKCCPVCLLTVLNFFSCFVFGGGTFHLKYVCLAEIWLKRSGTVVYLSHVWIMMQIFFFFKLSGPKSLNEISQICDQSSNLSF